MNTSSSSLRDVFRRRTRGDSGAARSDRHGRVQLAEHADTTEPDPVREQVLGWDRQLQGERRKSGFRGSLTRPNSDRSQSRVKWKTSCRAGSVNGAR